MTGPLDEGSLHDTLADGADGVTRCVTPAVFPEMLLKQVQSALTAIISLNV